MPALMFIVFGVLIVALVGVGLYMQAKRRQELRAWAHGHGLSFDPSRDSGMDDRFPGFRCLRQGHSRYAHNVMDGKWAGELPVTAFDYQYTTGSGKNQTTHNFSAVIVRSPVPLKPLFVRREGFFDKVGEFFGFDDIDFESAEFSRMFYVASPDRRWAYDVIHQRMMEYLMAAPNFTIEFEGLHVIASRSGRFRPYDFEAAVETVRGILDRLPGYLVRQQMAGG